MCILWAHTCTVSRLFKPWNDSVSNMKWQCFKYEMTVFQMWNDSVSNMKWQCFKYEMTVFQIWNDSVMKASPVNYNIVASFSSLIRGSNSRWTQRFIIIVVLVICDLSSYVTQVAMLMLRDDTWIYHFVHVCMP